MQNHLLRLCALMAVLSIVNCSSVTKQSRKQTILDVSQEAEVEGTGMSSADLRSMTEEKALEITAIKWPEKLTRVRIALTTVDNQTRFSLNPNLIKNLLLSDLVRASTGTKIQYTKNEADADYFLSVTITGLSKVSSETVNDYIVYNFELIDKARMIIWTGVYETKKQGGIGVIYR